MKYNIGDIIDSTTLIHTSNSYRDYKRNFLIVGESPSSYISLCKPNLNGIYNYGWTINEYDIKRYSIDNKFLGRRALYINKNEVSLKIDFLSCFYCDRNFVNLQPNFEFICWSCEIK